MRIRQPVADRLMVATAAVVPFEAATNHLETSTLPDPGHGCIASQGPSVPPTFDVTFANDARASERGRIRSVRRTRHQRRPSGQPSVDGMVQRHVAVHRAARP